MDFSYVADAWLSNGDVIYLYLLPHKDNSSSTTAQILIYCFLQWFCALLLILYWHFETSVVICERKHDSCLRLHTFIMHEVVMRKDDFLKCTFSHFFFAVLYRGVTNYNSSNGRFFVPVTPSTTYNVGTKTYTVVLWQLLALPLLERWWKCFLKCQNCCSELRFCLIIGCRRKGNGYHLSPLPLHMWKKKITIFSPETMWNAVMLPRNERSPCTQPHSKILLFWLHHSRCHF